MTDITNPPTQEDQDAFVAAFLARLTDFNERKTENCPYCGKHVSRLLKIGRCVYASPCQCRLWQGTIPEAWLK